DIGIEQIPHHLNRSSKAGRIWSGDCSGPPARKSALTPRRTAERRFFHRSPAPFLGRSTTASPSREISTSSTAKRKALGRRTACELPDLKIFVVSTIEQSSYICKRIYNCGAVGKGRRLAAALDAA